MIALFLVLFLSFNTIIAFLSFPKNVFDFESFFLYKLNSEVQKAVNKVRIQYSKWQDLLNDPRMSGREEYDLTTNELKNNIRSIEWDLEDLDETIGIVEANPRKFNMDMSELNKRKLFVKQTRDDITSIKEHLNSPSARTKVETSTRQVSSLLLWQ